MNSGKTSGRDSRLTKRVRILRPVRNSFVFDASAYHPVACIVFLDVGDERGEVDWPLK